jgi:hypothetical protein
MVEILPIIGRRSPAVHGPARGAVNGYKMQDALPSRPTADGTRRAILRHGEMAEVETRSAAEKSPDTGLF